MPPANRHRRDAFTLIELIVVIAIIGILITLILVASADGVRRAEVRQTQALIAKLEAALTDRVDALLALNPPVNQTHRYLASITFSDINGNAYAIPNSEARRAQVIAQFDMMKAELPDVFFLNDATYRGDYPLNFAAAPYPLSNPGGQLDFALPLGNYSPGLPYAASFNPADPNYVPTGAGISDSGIFGASFTAAAGFYKNLYEAAASDVAKAFPGAVVNAKRGYDASDNANATGVTLVDEMSEVTVSGGGAAFSDFQGAVQARLAKHTHKTARAEALYAVLVESQGPLGSVFGRDEFTNRDVADTDGDGLPEFIDAWGEPIQFYRWPIFYGSVQGSSDSQQGPLPYDGNAPRQLDPLDPNQLLVSSAWWTTSTSGNQGLPNLVTTLPVPSFSAGLKVKGPRSGYTTDIYKDSPASPQANAFMTYFHITIDPFDATAGTPSSNWDRTGATRRRAYHSKFLVLSGGPDKEPGVFQLAKNYHDDVDTSLSTGVAFPTGTVVIDATLLNWCESQAAQVEYAGRGGSFLEQAGGAAGSATSIYLQSNAGLDDITSHTLSGPGTGAK